MANLFIYLAVIVSGASVLAIEILGTRVLAPFYGGSIYLWSALIGVTLAALSVGYALGGRWADRGPKISRLASVIGLAGIWIAVIPWLRTPILQLTDALGLRTAVLVTATVLFFPPLALLGAVSPYAIRLKAVSLNEVGTTAGNLYAISTVASVVAAIATGFVLIPNVGVYKLIFLIGFILIATAVYGLVAFRNRVVAAVMPILLIAIGVVVFRAAPALTADPEAGLVAVAQSAYGEIRVLDHNDLRYLLIDGATHSIVDPLTWKSTFRYVQVLDIPKRFYNSAGSMLLLGLGGGSVAKDYASDGWQVDAVEIDPVVVAAARQYFALKPADAQVYTMDARKYLITHDRHYDIIIMDAFGSSSIPFHLITSEAFALIKAHLAPDGIFAVNVESVGWHDEIVRGVAATLEQHFKHVLALPIAEPPDQLGNLILLASDRDIDVDLHLPLPEGRFTDDYVRAHAWDNRFHVKPSEGRVLTDDLNPIDVWTDHVNLVERHKLHSFFADENLTW